eukprot:gnl/TRDRNA2_/TRDRNA2_148252_c0_seq2.p2 gnl/TRDRNA2_/TRDRNA2_148252_c0~~gnl/TRDRNA2_/TRDRNA2_148252_c0_seq2.p2  ORF type:complete len:112 (+),score=16.98 gnl/TRDRNA2_/TRDRNA2_148252_c0_seq2:29-364(+)
MLKTAPHFVSGDVFAKCPSFEDTRLCAEIPLVGGDIGAPSDVGWEDRQWIVFGGDIAAAVFEVFDTLVPLDGAFVQSEIGAVEHVTPDVNRTFGMHFAHVPAKIASLSSCV